MTPERFRKIRAVLDRRQPDLTVLAEDMRKSRNIAALIRTCDAIGIYRVHAVTGSNEFTNSHMSAAGSAKWVKTKQHNSTESAIEDLKSDGFCIVATSLSTSANDYREIDYTRKVAVITGSELPGISATAAALADEHITIPMRGMVDSLNVSVATALILYEAGRQREAAGLYANCRLSDEEYATTLFEWCYPHIARRCRETGVDYPALDDGGYFYDNPLPKRA